VVGGAVPTVSVYVAVAVTPEASVSVTANEWLFTVAVGVPLIIPSAASESPADNEEPPESVYE
jgi:hypothetical protein